MSQLQPFASSLLGMSKNCHMLTEQGTALLYMKPHHSIDDTLF